MNIDLRRVWAQNVDPKEMLLNVLSGAVTILPAGYLIKSFGYRYKT